MFNIHAPLLEEPEQNENTGKRMAGYKLMATMETSSLLKELISQTERQQMIKRG